LLQDAEHRVLTFDLPGHGKDKTLPSEVTLKNYTDRLCSILDNESEKVILVGHFIGGIVITQTAEYRPEKIQLLVYICAFLPANEQTLLQMPPTVVLSEDKTYLELKDDLIKDAFYGECSESDIFEAKVKLCVQPLLPFITPVHITEDHFEKVPRVYIETLKDSAMLIGDVRNVH
jgi:pimeloyl-ACP methyl ester carboxylesterase